MKESNNAFLEKNKVFKNDELNVKQFNKLDAETQAAILKQILQDIYTGSKELKVDNKYILKCLKLTCDEFDNEVHLPLGLLVKKEKNIITFVFKKRIGSWFIAGLVGALLFTIVSATYSAFNYINLRNLNKDLDGDGVADINIDMDEDEIADVNIDTNNDDKPDYNIDYRANRIPTFNIIDGDNILNPTNVLDKNGKCIRNCDINGDGWPDINIDLTGNGVATINIDLNDDGKPDLNIDLSGDGTCDLQCDTDDDGICDLYCVDNQSELDLILKGQAEYTGKSNTTNKTAVLEIDYVDLSDVVIDNILPDDMEGENTVIPAKRFSVTNKSPYNVLYSLKWENVKNTFVSDNFKFKVDCTPNCRSLVFTTAPKTDEVFLKNVVIGPNATHNYTITFKLQGTGSPQNEDQGRIFTAKTIVISD